VKSGLPKAAQRFAGKTAPAHSDVTAIETQFQLEEDTMPFVLCSDFTIFPDNLQLGPVFTLSGMDFQDNTGWPISIVNENNGLNGLQFPDTGLSVDFPIAVPWARLHVDQFASPFTIDGIDSNGNVTNSYSFNNPNSYWFTSFHKGDIATIRLTGGGNEGVLVSLCILIP
jgi:hypothetical protein